MVSTLFLLSMLLCLHSKQNVLVQGFVALDQKFNVTGPFFEFDGLRNINMDFIVSDLMKDSMIGYTFYDGFKCKDTDGGDTDITENSGYLLSRLRTDLTPIGDGSGERLIKVNANLDPSVMVDSPLYHKKSDKRGTIEYCLRFSIYSEDRDSPNAMEVNFLENIVTLDISLDGDFELDVKLAEGDAVVQQAYQDIATEGYLCDSDDNIMAVEEARAKSQGETVRICVSPTKESLALGAIIENIEEFTFYQGTTKQVAIEPNTGGVAAGPLTVISCQPGWTVCAFETLLNAKFFQEPGVVTGEGYVFLGLGNGEEGGSVARVRTRGRNLQYDPYSKSADELLAERATGFRMDITIMPVEKLNLEDQVGYGSTATRVLTTPMVLLLSIIPFLAL